MIVASQWRRMLRSFHVATAFVIDGCLIALADALQDRRPHACKMQRVARSDSTCLESRVSLHLRLIQGLIFSARN